MTLKELTCIADTEMVRDGFLSKGVRLEIVNAAMSGQDMTLTVSTDDAIRIGSEIRRRGGRGIFSYSRTDIPTKKIITINHSR